MAFGTNHLPKRLLSVSDTKFRGVPADIIGVRFKFDMEDPDWREKADREIVEKLIEKLT